MPAQPAHKRILLKLSGEALMGDDAFGINRATIVRMVQEVAEVVNMGVQVAVVVALLVAVPLGTTIAIYLSEFAGHRTRETI